MFELSEHPDKTFIGRIARGFDFQGFWYSPDGLSIAQKTVERMVDKVSRIYEPGADQIRIETYLKRKINSCTFVKNLPHSPTAPSSETPALLP